MNTILIVGGGLQGVSTARSLKEAGYRIGLWAPKTDFARKSSAVSFSGFYSDLEELEELIEFVKANKVEVVIPMSDRYTLFLSQNREKIPCIVAAPDGRVLNIASDKLKLMELCKVNNIPHPITVDAKVVEFESVPFPLMIKPNHSVGARGITLVNTVKELKDKLPKIQKEYGECHLQEYIEGNRPYYNVMLYRTREGNVYAYTILEIIRYYPLKGGSSSMCRTIDNPKLVNICSRTLEILGYYGFADFDVLQNKDGEYKIIEINPRVPASLRGAAISGVNFPAIIVADALNKPLPYMNYSPGKTLRYLGLDIMWFLSSPNRFKSNWFKFFGKNIFYQEGGLKDLKPMITSLLHNFTKVEFKHGRIRKKTSL